MFNSLKNKSEQLEVAELIKEILEVTKYIDYITD